MRSFVTGPQHGFIAISSAGRTGTGPDLRAALASIGVADAAYADEPGLATATWGVEDPGGQPLLLCSGPRRREHELSPDEVRRLLAAPGDDLAEVLPLFAAVDRVGEGTLVAAADVLGFRHLYHGAGQGFVVLSTSSRAIAACLGAELDREAIGVQSLLGWQLGDRTLFRGVHKLAAGELATLREGTLSTRSFLRPFRPAGRELDAAVREAADVLRGYMGAFLDDHPDAVLQLTGGQDSRLLLSAVPRERRRGLRTVTLGLPGNPDAVIAAELSRRFGLAHEVLTLAGVEELKPEEADRRCLEAAVALECMADPLAHAALAIAEARAEPGVRISGLGGEVARGFYYFGPPRSTPMTRRKVALLARWRMFTNESVPTDVLDPEFSAWSREYTVGEVYALSSAGGRDWMSATDDFYLEERMQRWAGVTGTAVCFDRVVTNPMLDDRFIDIARSLAPRDKRNSMFLSRLQVELDEELAHLPLDGRPPPITYATSSLSNTGRQLMTTAGKIVRKAQQRASRTNRPPAGAEVLAAKLAEHWRANPALLDPVRQARVFRDGWIDELLTGEAAPSPSAAALITNLRVVSR